MTPLSPNRPPQILKSGATRLPLLSDVQQEFYSKVKINLTNAAPTVNRFILNGL
jgi:hypothetical protein